MTSGKCPHPWNKRKKGTFKKGHKNVNPKGKGQFIRGKLKYPKIREINRILGKERYIAGIHPFYKINQFAVENANTEAYYGMKKSEWIKMRRRIKDRDKWKCRRCGCDLHKRKSNCHHKIPYSISKDNSMKNLETLCISCHIIKEQRFRKKSLKSKEVPENPKV